MECLPEQLSEYVHMCLNQETERDFVEFKEGFQWEENLWQIISSMSNILCINNKDIWCLIYGVKDGSLEICGTNFDPDREKIGWEPLMFKLNKNLWNTNIFSHHILEVNSKRLVVFVIKPAIDRPIQYKHIPYIRIWTSRPRLNDHPDLERKIWNNLYNRNYENQVIKYWLMPNEVFKLLDISLFLQHKWIALELDNIEQILYYLKEEWYVTSGLGRYNITHLWALLYAKSLWQFYDSASKWIRVIQYNWNDKMAESKIMSGDKWYAVWFEGLMGIIKLLLPNYEYIDETWKRLQKTIYPLIALREFIANAIIHQDLSCTGQNIRIEIFWNRIEITNPWIPIIDVTRFIDSWKARNDLLSDKMRKLWFCEKLWWWVDKAIIEIEKSKLPAPKIETIWNETKVTLFSQREIENLTREDKMRACYQHSVIRWISHDYMNNASLRERLWLKETQHNIASKIIKDATSDGLIKVLDPEQRANKYIKYIPFWA